MKNKILDDFALAESWQGIASGEAEIYITSEPCDLGRALRLDFGRRIRRRCKVFANRTLKSLLWWWTPCFPWRLMD